MKGNAHLGRSGRLLVKMLMRAMRSGTQHKADTKMRSLFVRCTSFSCSGVETGSVGEAARRVVNQVLVLGMERVVKKTYPSRHDGR